MSHGVKINSDHVFDDASVCLHVFALKLQGFFFIISATVCKANTFWLLTRQIWQIGQWPHASKFDAVGTALASVLDVTVSISVSACYMLQCLTI